MSIHVNVDNFARAETSRMFRDLVAAAGGLNRWTHVRRPTSIDAQTVIRMNRDTLYSFAIVDATDGATVTLPDAGDRYLSLMVIDEDHYVTETFHEPGEHSIDPPTSDSPFIGLVARTLVDPADRADVDAVNALQDHLGLDVDGSSAFEHPDYDTESLDVTRRALLQLAGGIEGFDRTFGRRDEVDPVRHLLGTAAGWGGLPEHEAFYLNQGPGLAVGDYDLRVHDVPVDAFWSISMYNRGGFFEKNDFDAYSVNDVTAVRDADGAITIRFGIEPKGAVNFLPITDGWNYIVRLYRPRPEILDGSWTFPTPQLVS